MRVPGYRSHRNALLGCASYLTMNRLFNMKPKRVVRDRGDGVLIDDKTKNVVPPGELEAWGYIKLPAVQQETSRARRRAR